MTPNAEEKTEGKQGANLYDLNAVTDFAMVSAFHASGLGLTHAAKLALELKWHLHEVSVGYIGRFKQMSLQLERPSLDHIGELKDDEDFYFRLHHEYRVQNVSGYDVGVARDDDIVIAVADQKYVFLHQIKPKLKHAPSPVCEISSDGELRPIYEMNDWEARQTEIEEIFTERLHNALGVVRINVSLAVRICLDRIHDLRMEKGGKAFMAWE